MRLQQQQDEVQVTPTRVPMPEQVTTKSEAVEPVVAATSIVNTHKHGNPSALP